MSNQGKTILVTGGAGYIGSHTVVELLAGGHDVVVLDNLANSKASAIERIEEIAGRRPDFVRADLLDAAAVESVFKARDIHAVIHFAGLKAVGESVAIPLRYYHNNLTGTFHLCAAMERAGCRRLVFSSSATVYGDPACLPITEDFPLGATNPYGRTKLMLEEVLRDVHASNPEWRIALLRYFNPVGAHESGLIGEDPNGIPNNLVPYIAQVAVGRLEKLRVFGGDYPTPDGTGVRDYIHVVDLALGHVRAIESLDAAPGIEAFNLGTGRGTSVLEMVEAFTAACGKPIPHEIVERRPGDIAACFANADKARDRLGWAATRDVAAMCADTWRWQSMNPNGLP